MPHWRYIQEDAVSAYYGLAADEYLMTSCADNEAILRLYTYRDYCALVGRFQNIKAELNLNICQKENFQYSRRLTGGGAIIMGQEQLGLCFVTMNTFGCADTREMYQVFSAPVIKALEKLGIQAKLRGKNDLEVDGKKIAGLGIHVNPFGAIQFHTSLLVDLDIPTMLKVLNIPLQKIGDKAQIQKVGQRITTVSRELNRKIKVDEVRHLIKKYFENQFTATLEYQPFSIDEHLEIEKLASQKYNDEDWIFQRSPLPDMTGMGLKKTKEGLLRTYVALKGEVFKSVLITGDYSEQEPLFKHIETQLKWSPLKKENVERVVKKAFEELGQNNLGLTTTDVQDSIWRAAMGAMKEVRYTYKGSCYYPEKKSMSEEENKY
ncbi:MAG: lipoate--protein ligase family protein [Bacteroidetes bacterium]|nr:lipoate--protein ligase family protein [Bacteroidota bacterium]